MSKLLDEYRRKRSADRTPEPMGAGAARPGVFVVQKHSATRMHYDLRLEWDGVLKSWAVPKGPHPDPAEKRLAMQTEDHPVEYADFEGVIPDGGHGAGPMMFWNRGLWRPAGAPRAGGGAAAARRRRCPAADASRAAQRSVRRSRVAVRAEVRRVSLHRQPRR